MSSATNVLTAFSVLFGISLGILAEFWVSFGNIQIKYSHKLDTLKFHHQPVWKRCRWWFGFAMYIFNALFKFASYLFASLNIISPTSATSIIITAFLARWYFKEKLTVQGIIGSTLILIGCALAVIFGAHGQDSVSLDELFKYANTASFIWFTTIHITLCVIFGIIGIVLVKMQDQKTEEYNSPIISFDDQNENAETPFLNMNMGQKSHNKLQQISEIIPPLIITEQEKNEFTHVLSCFFLIFTTSGVVAWVQMFGKIAADLLWQSIFENNNQFTTLTSYIILLIIAVGLCLELYFISEVMRLFDAVLVCPIYNSLFIFTSIGISAAFFKNFEDLSILNIVLFTIGLLFIIWGMLLLMYGQSKSSMEHQNLDRKLSLRSRTSNC